MASRFHVFMHGRNGTAAASAVAAAATSMFLSSSSPSWMGNHPKVTFLEDDAVPPPQYPWPHLGPLSSYHHGALRRGFQVYREVCAACHSLQYLHWRDFENVTHTKAQLKKLAATYDYPDGPNDEGEMYERPGKWTDWMPQPYANPAIGRLANNGALPPDLSLMTKARHQGQDYVFSLLTGYGEPPAGKPMMPGLHYNPYFPGGAIAMTPPLSDGQVEYEDGTVATVSQMARDVVQFLDFCAQPEMEARKKLGFIVMPTLFFMLFVTGFWKRYTWSIWKTRKIEYYHPDRQISWKRPKSDHHH